jgi:hypothetical protein
MLAQQCPRWSSAWCCRRVNACGGLCKSLTHSAHSHSSKRSVPLSTALVCRRVGDAVMPLSRCRACTTTKRVSGEQAGRECGRVGGWVRGRKVKVAVLRFPRLSCVGACGLSQGFATPWEAQQRAGVNPYFHTMQACRVCLPGSVNALRDENALSVCCTSSGWDVWDVCLHTVLSLLVWSLCLFVSGLNSATKSAQEGVLAERCVGDHSTRPNQQRRGLCSHKRK